MILCSVILFLHIVIISVRNPTTKVYLCILAKLRNEFLNHHRRRRRLLSIAFHLSCRIFFVRQKKVYLKPHLSKSSYNDSSNGRADDCILLLHVWCLLLVCVPCTRWGKACSPEDLCLRVLTFIEGPAPVICLVADTLTASPEL
jgi:hypothetical protein